jgi:sugar phosphate isomerase/epimerase
VDQAELTEAKQRKARMLRLSMNQLSTLRWSFEQDVQAYAAAGFESIGVWRHKLSDIGEERGVELLNTAGLTVSNLLWAGGFTGSDGRSYRDAVRDAIEAIHTCSRLNSECLIIYTGSWGGHTRTHANRLVTNAFKQLLPHAEEFGITLALEPMSSSCGTDWTFLSTARDALDIIEPIENPFLKIALDLYHFGIDHEPDLQALADIVDRIAIVHLGDGVTVPVGEQNRCLLGTGRIPLRKILDVLREYGFDGFLDVELLGESVEHIPYEELIEHSLHSMQDLLATV